MAKSIRIELTKDEHSQVKAAAALAGVSLAEWCKAALLIAVKKADDKRKDKTP